jgi:hypothetical protein
LPLIHGTQALPSSSEGCLISALKARRESASRYQLTASSWVSRLACQPPYGFLQIASSESPLAILPVSYLLPSIAMKPDKSRAVNPDSLLALYKEI